jgi:hypothetical protein
MQEDDKPGLVDECVVGEGDQLIVTQIQLVETGQPRHQLRAKTKQWRCSRFYVVPARHQLRTKNKTLALQSLLCFTSQTSAADYIKQNNGTAVTFMLYLPDISCGQKQKETKWRCSHFYIVTAKHQL